MNISRRVMLYVITGFCIITAPYAASAQEGEALSADEVLLNNINSSPPVETSKNTLVKAVDKELEEALLAAKAENEDEELLAKKVKLAKEMHKIRTAREQVNAAVLSASLGLPAQDRAGFVSAMESMLNYNAIERISMDAMVETFTFKELDAMVEYYSKPEATISSKKIPSWASVVQPEIARMIDRALMRLRTGQ